MCRAGSALADVMFTESALLRLGLFRSELCHGAKIITLACLPDNSKRLVHV